MSFFGFFLAMAGDSCGARDCNADFIAIGLMVAVGLPWILLIVVAIVSIVLLVLDVILTAVMSFFGFFLAMAGDSCGVRDCSTDLIAIGMMVAIGLPWAVLLVVVVVSIIVLVRRRLAFWVPLVGAVLIVASLVLGFIIAGSGVPAS